MLMLTVIVALAALGAIGVAAASLTFRSLALRSVLKPSYRRIAYRALTAIGRNYTGIDLAEWSRTVAIATTQSELRQSCRVLENDAGMRLVETPLGAFWIPETEREGYDGFLLMVAEELNNHYHFEGAAYVLDCGANLGTFTRLALSRGARVVVAIEPAPEIVRCLQRTFAQEILLGRVILVERGLWNRDDRLFLRTSSEDSWNNTIIAHENGQQGAWVPLTTIDKIVADLNLPSVSFIKMDIEGAEVKALDGAKATIRGWKPVIAVATEHTEEKLKNTADVVAMVKAAGPYSDVCIKGSIRRTRPLLGVGIPNSVMPEIMLLRPDSASMA
jgi:FkbM family methyltransferase